MLDLELVGDSLELGQFDGNGNWNNVFLPAGAIVRVMLALLNAYEVWTTEGKRP